MIIKLVEIFEISRHHSENTPFYSLREIFVNPEHVTCLREDEHTVKKLEAGLLPEQLDVRQRFTKIHLNRGFSGIDIIVVGDPSSIKEKLNKDTRTLLKG
jgi:hypothetical protein